MEENKIPFNKIQINQILSDENKSERQIVYGNKSFYTKRFSNEMNNSLNKSKSCELVKSNEKLSIDLFMTKFLEKNQIEYSCKHYVKGCLEKFSLNKTEDFNKHELSCSFINKDNEEIIEDVINDKNQIKNSGMVNLENWKSIIKEVIEPMLQKFLEVIENRCQEKHLATIQKYIDDCLAKNKENNSYLFSSIQELLFQNSLQERKEDSNSSFSLFSSKSNDRQNDSKPLLHKIINPDTSKDDKNKTQELFRKFPKDGNSEFTYQNNQNSLLSNPFNTTYPNKIDFSLVSNKTNQNSVTSIKQKMQQTDYILKSVINISDNVLITTSASSYEILQIWDIEKKICHRKNIGFPVYSIAKFSNENIACGSSKGKLYVFNIKIFKILTEFHIHDNSVICLTLLSNGYLASGSQDKTIKIFDPKNLNPSNLLSYEHKQPVVIICEFSNNKIISSCQDNLIYVWDIENKNFLFNLNEQNQELITSIVKISDVEIATSSYNKLIIWNIQQKDKKIILSNNKINNFTCLTLFNNQQLVSGGSNNCIIKWDIINKKEYKRFTSNSLKSQIKSLIKVSENRLIALDDNDIDVWDSVQK